VSPVEEGTDHPIRKLDRAATGNRVASDGAARLLVALCPIEPLTRRLGDDRPEDVDETRAFLASYFEKSTGAYFECTSDEGEKAFLHHRFAAAGAAVRYRTLHISEVENVVALDIALRRNDRDWIETLPPDIEDTISIKLYCGHFLCHAVPPGLHRQEAQRLPQSRTQDVEATGPPRRRIFRLNTMSVTVLREVAIRCVLSTARSVQLLEPRDRGRRRSSRSIAKLHSDSPVTRWLRVRLTVCAAPHKTKAEGTSAAACTDPYGEAAALPM
jgi:hypothetical protein